MEVNQKTLRFFRTPAELNRWLNSNHAKATELWVGMYRKDTGKRSIDYKQALDEALCFGWIDGIRKKLDDESFATRFTPRKPRSIWSNVNVAHVERLTREKRMRPAGIAAFEKRTPERTGLYSFERAHAELDPAMVKEFRKNKEAWKFFSAQTPYYRRLGAWYILSAKRDETRKKRLAALIAASAKGKRLL
jgi:uncharacterized protein YdeI (YjbR/CyaY-like superfamily)